MLSVWITKSTSNVVSKNLKVKTSPIMTVMTMVNKVIRNEYNTNNKQLILGGNEASLKKNNNLFTLNNKQQLRCYSTNKKSNKTESEQRLSHEECVKIYDYWKSQGKKINFTFYRQFIQHCNNLVWSQPQYLKKAFEIGEDMKKDGYPWDIEIYFYLIQCCIRTRINTNLDTAFQLFDEMKTKGVQPTQLVYNALIRGCALLDQQDRAKVVYDEAVQTKVLESKFKFEDIYKHLKEF
ncbi:hypothetical protein ABK040_000412 [Willaertia magna]